jgi:hypothetical protein
VLYNFLNEIYIPVKLISVIKVCLNEINSGVRVGKCSSDTFPVKECFEKKIRCFMVFAFLPCFRLCQYEG